MTTPRPPGGATRWSITTSGNLRVYVHRVITVDITHADGRAGVLASFADDDRMARDAESRPVAVTCDEHESRASAHRRAVDALAAYHGWDGPTIAVYE